MNPISSPVLHLRRPFISAYEECDDLTCTAEVLEPEYSINQQIKEVLADDYGCVPINATNSDLYGCCLTPANVTSLISKLGNGIELQCTEPPAPAPTPAPQGTSTSSVHLLLAVALPIIGASLLIFCCFFILRHAHKRPAPQPPVQDYDQKREAFDRRLHLLLGGNAEEYSPTGKQREFRDRFLKIIFHTEYEEHPEGVEQAIFTFLKNNKRDPLIAPLLAHGLKGSETKPHNLQLKPSPFDEFLELTPDEKEKLDTLYKLFETKYEHAPLLRAEITKLLGTLNSVLEDERNTTSDNTTIHTLMANIRQQIQRLLISGLDHATEETQRTLSNTSQVGVELHLNSFYSALAESYHQPPPENQKEEEPPLDF